MGEKKKRETKINGEREEEWERTKKKWLVGSKNEKRER